MDVEVIRYSDDFPTGYRTHIDSDQIEKFYATPGKLRYIIKSRYIEEVWSQNYKNLIISGKLFSVWDTDAKRMTAFVKPDCHPVMIEVRYASPTNIYDGSIYIQHYWSDMTLEEFTKTYGSLKYKEKVEEEGLMLERYEILDLRKEQ